MARIGEQADQENPFRRVAAIGSADFVFFSESQSKQPEKRAA
jgi:hypothetical protein